MIASYNDVRPSGFSDDTESSSDVKSLASKKPSALHRFLDVVVECQREQFVLRMAGPRKRHVAATTSPIFARMLPLLSRINPTDTGVSSLLNRVIGRRLSVVENGKALLCETADEPALFVCDARGQNHQMAGGAAEVWLLPTRRAGKRDQEEGRGEDTHMEAHMHMLSKRWRQVLRAGVMPISPSFDVHPAGTPSTSTAFSYASEGADARRVGFSAAGEAAAA